MSAEPLPGTIPFRALEALRKRPDWNPSTVELCEELGIDTYDFTAFMRPAREQGLVWGDPKPGNKVLFWRLGDGKSVDLLFRGERDKPLHPNAPAPKPADLSGEILPGVRQRQGFRALVWEGNLLATGMQIIEGVAVFTPDQIMEIKRQTTWAVSS